MVSRTKLLFQVETLAARVARQGSLHERDAVGWAIRLCKRVEELHRHGVAHGGISADVVLTDADDCTSHGKLGDVRHSAIRPAYHSPERIAGHGISQADDTWAIAVTLYFLLTGTMPFAGNTAAEIQERLSMAPAPLAVFDVGDDALQAILDRFLSRAMAQRVVQTTALRDALSRWKHGQSVAHLPPLEEEADESYSDYDDDDDDEEEVATVMRDFTEVREHLKRMDRAPRPAAGAPPPPAPRPSAGTRPRPAAGAPARAIPPQAHPTPAMGVVDHPGFTPPQRPMAQSHETLARPGAPVPRPSSPGLPQGAPPPRASGPGLGSDPGLRPADAPLQTPYDVDDDDSDEDVRTVLMDAENNSDLSAAIEEALAAKQQRQQTPSGRPPGWPPGPPPGGAAPSGGEDEESLAPTAAFDASMLPDGAMPDPLLPSDPPPAADPLATDGLATDQAPSTVDRLLQDIPPPPAPEPDSGLDHLGLGPAPPAPHLGTGPSGLNPAPGMGTTGPHGMGGDPGPGFGLGEIPGTGVLVETPRSGLRTALIVAVVVLVIVVLAVTALYLDRRGIIDLGLPREAPAAPAAPPPAPAPTPAPAP